MRYSSPAFARNFVPETKTNAMPAAKIKVSLATNDLSEETKEAMWAIYRSYYHYDRSVFMERFGRNTHYAFYRSGDRLIGFTGLRINRTKVSQCSRLLIYFGQTIIEREYRGQGLIQRTGALLCYRYFWQILCSRAYFWADTLTYKAYLVFAKTLREYYPNFRKDNPADIEQLIAYIGQTHYPDSYCPESGTVSKPVNYVADRSTAIHLSDTRDADVLFFTLANPNHIDGHGLITLGPINYLNLLAILRKIGKKYLSRIRGKRWQPAPERLRML